MLIVGDLVADQFLNGTIGRVSREAPVFILRHDETETRAGGAANAAANIASLGGEALLAGFVGADENGRLLSEALLSAGVDPASVIASSKLRTTTKVRVLAGQHYAPRQQVIRIDYESDETPAPEEIQALESRIEELAKKADVIAISDYGYGTVTERVYQTALSSAVGRSIPLLIDSRFALRRFAGATAATPNQEEVEQLLGKHFTVEDCERLREELGYSCLLVTQGNKGMLLLDEGQMPLSIPAVGSSEPVDVTGAGDTVLAAFSLGIASGLSAADSARLANHAGGIVVMKRGTAAVTCAEIAESLAVHGEEALSLSHL